MADAARRPHLRFRPEIQGLRAIAVLAVFAFHLWPSGWLAGGYVGVDVFFVISGFLITGLLLKEFEASGSISIRRFYARRIRRLLPAATLVLLAVAALMILFPRTQWRDIIRDIAASALYVQNWNLAHRAIDYLASQGAAGPLQHFWSLAVEEQYYLVWPLLAALATGITAAARRYPRVAFGVFVSAIGVASLAYSVIITKREPGLAYFATTTRAWELALGGALAVFRGWERWPRLLRALMGPAGAALIVAACLIFNQNTTFPGSAALLPTIGTAMVIICSDCGGQFGLRRLLTLGPIQYIGDVSYSLYLWHWPVIAVFAQLHGPHISWRDALAVFALSLLLAHLSKRFVEDPLRSRSKPGKAGVKNKPFVLATGCIALSLGTAAAVFAIVPSRSVKPIRMAGLKPDVNHPGALYLSDGTTPENSHAPYQPDPVAAKRDHPARACHAGLTSTKLIVCNYGDDAPASRHVVLLGDSHADQWLPAFRMLARRKNWYLTAMTKSACAFADVDIKQFTTDANRSCAAWNRMALARLRQYKPDAVFIAQSVYSLGHIEGKPSAAARKLLVTRMVKAWKALADAGITLYVIRDTPLPAGNIPDCMSKPGATIGGCSRSRKKATKHADPVVMAARQVGRARLIDLTDSICGPKKCRAVVGNVLVYRDTHHLSATYVRTLAPALSTAIDAYPHHSGAARMRQGRN